MERLSLSPNVFKIDDNNRILKVFIDSDGYQVRPSNDGSVYTLKVANDTGYVKDVPVDITIDTVTGISNLTVQTNTMLDLSADSLIIPRLDTRYFSDGRKAPLKHLLWCFFFRFFPFLNFTYKYSIIKL